LSTLSLNEIVKVTINLSPLSAVRNAFNLGLIIGTSTVIPALERVRKYTSTTDMISDGFSLSSPEYIAASIFLSQSLVPTYVYIGRQDLTATETPLQAVEACRLANSDWYTVTFANVIPKADILAVAGYLEPATPASAYFYTTHDTDALSGAAGNVFTSLKALSYKRSIGQYSTYANTTAGFETGAINAAIDIHSGTASTFKIAVDGDATPKSIVLTLANCTSGVNIATEMQYQIRSIGGAYANVSVVFNPTTVNYIITSGTTGSLSTVVVTAGATNDVSTTLKIGVANGATDTTGTTTYVPSVVAIMGYAMGANDGTANSTYTLAYKQEVGVTTENLTTTQVSTIKGNNGNVYINRGSQYNLFEQGHMANGTSFDELINLDKLQNDIQLTVMDLLYQNRKIAQTDAGVNQIVHALNVVCESNVTIGFIAPGIWNAAAVKNLATGDTLPKGYLIQADTVASQSQADRDARKSPNIYIAVKLAGAIEYVLITVDVNR
jgi:hypothetical protein